MADDVVTNQLVAVGYLKAFGLRADAVANGVDALAAMRSTDYDLIIMELHMPTMDGLEATRQIRRAESASGRHVPIIGLTASVEESDRRRCLESGMDDYLPKPVSAHDLAAVLRRWLPN